MSDFLNFLNTADLDTLTKIPGITRPLAGNLVAARPFDTVDDCLQVRGMGKALLTRMQSFYEEGESATMPPRPPEEENRAMVTVENAAPIETNPPAKEDPKTEQPSFLVRLWRAFANFLLALFRFVLTLAFIGAIAAGLYFGIPYLNEKLIAPVEENTASIHSLETKIGELQTQISDLQTQLDTVNARMDSAEQTIESQSARIAKLEDMQSTLEKEITAQNNSVMIALKREIIYTRSVEMLSRARLYLSQSNFGLAKQDVQSARDLLADLKTDAPDYQHSTFDSILTRLDLALGNLPAFPVIAADDVDIAWELMMRGLPESAADVMTPTPATLTPTPQAEATPTP